MNSKFYVGVICLSFALGSLFVHSWADAQPEQWWINAILGASFFLTLVPGFLGAICMIVGILQFTDENR